ncbi:leucyl aminopeptidase [soil metagenome]
MKVISATDNSNVTGTFLVSAFSGDLEEQLTLTGLSAQEIKTISQNATALNFTATSGQTLNLFLAGNKAKSSKTIILFSLGERDKLNRSALYSAILAALNAGKGLKATDLVLTSLNLEGTSVNYSQLGEVISEAAMQAEYSYTLKTELGGHKEPHRIHSLSVQNSQPEVKQALTQGDVIAYALALAKRLSDTPANIMTPEQLKDEAIAVAGRSGGRIEIKILDKTALTSLGANGILAVGSGSSHPCYMIELSYTPPSGATKKKLAMVGKSVCFDAGGLCLKTATGMLGMQRDMTGGGIVLAVIEAIAKLGIPLSVNAYMAPVFNMLGDDAAKVGDVMQMLGGLTVENTNTDAEGRLTLADMVAWAQIRGCNTIVDIATLTGAAVQITGDAAACIMGNDEAFTSLIVESGKATDEALQPLIMFEKIRKYNRDGKIADLKNSVGSVGAGTIVAAWFIREFIKEIPWAHLDIAPVSKEGNFGVKTLIHLVKTLAEQASR